jgi:hypothetical protein
MKKLLLILPAIALFLQACNLQKDVNVDLPPFKSQLVVECYIYPNQPVELALTQTQNYFGTNTNDTAILKNLFVNDADVKIIYMGKTYPMKFNPFPNIAEFKFFNYKMQDSLPYKEGETISLQVTDKQGRSVTAQTVWLSKVPIDSITYAFNSPSDSFTNLVVGFKDNGATKDYYRFQAKKLNADTGSRINREVVDYSTDDAIFNGLHSDLGTPRRYKHHDTAEVTLFHITPEYYRFITTSQLAQNSNGSPFAEPTNIESNIVNGLGIFTALPVIEGQEEKTIVIK